MDTATQHKCFAKGFAVAFAWPHDTYVTFDPNNDYLNKKKKKNHKSLKAAWLPVPSNPTVKRFCQPKKTLKRDQNMKALSRFLCHTEQSDRTLYLTGEGSISTLGEAE